MIIEQEQIDIDDNDVHQDCDLLFLVFELFLHKNFYIRKRY